MARDRVWPKKVGQQALGALPSLAGYLQGGTGTSCGSPRWILHRKQKRLDQLEPSSYEWAAWSWAPFQGPAGTEPTRELP